VIPASDTKYLTIKADVNHYSQIQSGGSVALGLATSSVTAVGAVSGSDAGTVPSSSVTGNTMYTYKTTVSVSLNSKSPSGNSFPSANQHILYFDVTNNGAYEAQFNAATFTVNYTVGTGNTTTSANRTFYLYDSTDLNNAIGSATIATGTTINGMSIAIDVSPDYAIPANSTKTFYLIGDTSDAGVTSGSNAGSRLQVYISSGTNFNWDDEVSTSVASSVTKSFPLYGNTLTY